MSNLKKMGSCIELFKPMKILPFYSQHIFSLVLYMVNNRLLLIKKLDICNFVTISVNNFQQPCTNLTRYQKGAHYAGIKSFNHLPTHMKCATNEIQAFE
jgi:hypothetical protein